MLSGALGRVYSLLYLIMTRAGGGIRGAIGEDGGSGRSSPVNVSQRRELAHQHDEAFPAYPGKRHPALTVGNE